MGGSSESEPLFEGSSLSSSLPSVAELSAARDLTASCLLAVLGPVLLAYGGPPVLRAVVALPLVLFVPGYVGVAAVYPGEGRDTDVHSPPEGAHFARFESVTFALRLALSITLSALLVAVLAVLVGTVWSIGLVPVGVAIAVFTVAVAAVALERRRELPPQRRYAPGDEVGLLGLEESLTTDSGVVLVGAAVLTALLLATSGVLAAGAGGGDVTEFYVAGEDGNASVTLGEYDETIVAGEESSHRVVVEHDGDVPQTFDVVVLLSRLDDGEVRDTRQINETEVTVDGDGRASTTVPIRLFQADERFRVTYLLFADDPPDRPAPAEALRHLHVEVTVVG